MPEKGSKMFRLIGGGTIFWRKLGRFGAFLRAGDI